MNKAIYIFCILMLASSCELFVIKAPYRQRAQQVEISQRSPLGVVYLFKTELDSNNIFAALSLLATDQGQRYFAYERFEKKYEISRVKRFLQDKQITDVRTDTLSDAKYNFNIELNWTKQMQFSAVKIKDSWYISSYAL